MTPHYTTHVHLNVVVHMCTVAQEPSANRPTAVHRHPRYNRLDRLQGPTSQSAGRRSPTGRPGVTGRPRGCDTTPGDAGVNRCVTSRLPGSVAYTSATPPGAIETSGKSADNHLARLFTAREFHQRLQGMAVTDEKRITHEISQHFDNIYTTPYSLVYESQ